MVLHKKAGLHKKPGQEEAAGRERVVTRERGPCRPSVLLPPPVTNATTSYHEKVTRVSNPKVGHEGGGEKGVRFAAHYATVSSHTEVPSVARRKRVG